MLNIIINKEYEEIVPRVTQEDYTKLKESIQENGLWYPIVVNRSGVLLDGHHRYHVCQDLGIKPSYVVKDFENELYEKLFVINANLKRRQLERYMRGKLTLVKKPIIEEIVRRSQLSGLKQNQKNNNSTVAQEFVQRYGRSGTNKELAKEAEMSHETLRKIEILQESATQELQEKLEKNEVSVDYAFKSIKGPRTIRIFHHCQPENLILYLQIPHGIMISILGDHPDEHYATMTNQQIESLQVPSAENAILFLWATAPKIKEALDVMKSWGFKYKTNAVWIKQHFWNRLLFQGSALKSYEFGEKGEMPVPEEHNRPSSVIQADRTQHSVKPPVVYLLIEKMYPNRKYLELFARSQFNQNWTVWGNEVQINAFV